MACLKRCVALRAKAQGSSITDAAFQPTTRKANVLWVCPPFKLSKCNKTQSHPYRLYDICTSESLPVIINIACYRKFQSIFIINNTFCWILQVFMSRKWPWDPLEWRADRVRSTLMIHFRATGSYIMRHLCSLVCMICIMQYALGCICMCLGSSACSGCIPFHRVVYRNGFDYQVRLLSFCQKSRWQVALNWWQNKTRHN